MAKFIVLANWTDQGIKNVRESAGRVDAAREMAKKLGCTMGDFYMTAGVADMVFMVDAPDDAAMATFSLGLASKGNIRTTTMKAFTEAEYRKITGAA